MTNEAVYTVLRFLGLKDFEVLSIIASTHYLFKLSEQDWVHLKAKLVMYYVAQNIRDLPPEYNKVVDENFWGLM